MTCQSCLGCSVRPQDTLVKLTGSDPDFCPLAVQRSLLQLNQSQPVLKELGRCLGDMPSLLGVELPKPRALLIALLNSLSQPGARFQQAVMLCHATR